MADGQDTLSSAPSTAITPTKIQGAVASPSFVLGIGGQSVSLGF